MSETHLFVNLKEEGYNVDALMQAIVEVTQISFEVALLRCFIMALIIVQIFLVVHFNFAVLAWAVTTIVSVVVSKQA